MKHTFGGLLMSALMFLAIACNNNKTTTAIETDSTAVAKTNAPAVSNAERNKAVVMASMAAYNNHNVDEVLKSAAANIIDYGDGTDTPITNKDTLSSMMKKYFAAFPDAKGDSLTYVADGNDVVVLGTWTGTFKGELMGMKPTNKSFKYKDADIFTLNDAGQIVSHRGTVPSKIMWMQVGAKM